MKRPKASAAACAWPRSSPESEDAGKVVPLEENIYGAESNLPQHLFVLVQPIRHEHVLERFALLGDLDLAVAVSLLELVIVLNEEPIQQRVFTEHLLDEDQAAIFMETAADVLERA